MNGKRDVGDNCNDLFSFTENALNIREKLTSIQSVLSLLNSCDTNNFRIL